MKLFILGAGKGTRLYPLTKNTPKLLIDLGDGLTLLGRQLENAIASKCIDEVIVITGYLHQQIDDKIKEYQDQISISTVFNPFFDVSNNLMSLWIAKEFMRDEDFMITNGDNMYKTNVYQAIQTEKSSTIQVTIDYKDEYDEDDMKVSFFPDGRVKRVHKQINIDEVGAESVGLCLVKGEDARNIFVSTLEELGKEADYLNRFWLEIFNRMSLNGNVIDTVEVQHDEWNEVDFHPDINIIKQFIASHL